MEAEAWTLQVFQALHLCVLLAKTQRNLQLNWPVIRGWDFVSRVVSTTQKKARELEASL